MGAGQWTIANRRSLVCSMYNECFLSAGIRQDRFLASLRTILLGTVELSFTRTDKLYENCDSEQGKVVKYLSSTSTKLQTWRGILLGLTTWVLTACPHLTMACRRIDHRVDLPHPLGPTMTHPILWSSASLSCSILRTWKIPKNMLNGNTYQSPWAELRVSFE